MASSTTISSVIQSLQQSTGAIKAKATQIVSASQGIAGAGQTFELTGNALANLQDQINNTRKNSLALAQFVQSSTTISIGSDTQVIFNDKNVLTGVPQLTFNYTTGYLTVLSLDGNYSVAIGEPSTGIGVIVEHLTTSDKVEIAGKSITALKAGVAGKTIWFLADNGSGDGTLGVSNGSGTGGLDGNGAIIFGSAASELLQAYAFQAISPSTGSEVVNIVPSNINLVNSTGALAAVITSAPGYGIVNVRNSSGTIICQMDAATGVTVADASASDTASLTSNTLSIANSSGLQVIYASSSSGGGQLELSNSGSVVLYNTSAEPTFSAQSGAGYGVLSVLNGTGSGGFDLIGGTIFGNGSTGKLEVVNQLVSSLGGGGTQMVVADNSGNLGVQAIAGFPATWTVYNPTVTGGGGGSIGVVSATGAYIQTGKTVFFNFSTLVNVTGTITAITLSLPVNPYTSQTACALVADSSGNNAGGVSISTVNNSVNVYKPNTSSYGALAGIAVSGVYQTV